MCRFRFLVLFSLLVAGFADLSQAASCSGASKITGFSTVKAIPGGKTYFFKEPRACAEGQPCSWKMKAYLVPENFVQTAQVQGDFVCAVFRNFDGWGGRKTIGWLPLSVLAPIRTRLERRDLLGSWLQIPCPAGDDCEIEIAEDEKKQLSVNIDSHLHSHPGSAFHVSEVKEEKGKLLLTGTESGEERSMIMELVYDAKDLEPGTISLSGEDSFEGIYRK